MGVVEWDVVEQEARHNGKGAHAGRVFAILVEKNHELDEDNLLRKFKGRVVFQGNNVKDENWEFAMFRELS
eukprot:6082854-Prorocentrum_lima.AAC.1